MSDNDYSISSDDDIPTNTNHTTTHADADGTIYVTSYSHKRGPLIPTPDITFDLRTLPNPPKNVRTNQSGIHLQLREWLFANPDVQTRFNNVYDSILARAREAADEGKNRLNVGVFCQMGRHRSVTFVEELGRRHFDNWAVDISHRDLHLKRSDTRQSRNKKTGDSD